MVLKPICVLLPAALLFVSSAEAETYQLNAVATGGRALHDCLPKESAGLISVTPVPADPDNAANIYLTAGADYMTETLPQFRTHAQRIFVASADLMPQRAVNSADRPS